MKCIDFHYLDGNICYESCIHVVYNDICNYHNIWGLLNLMKPSHITMDLGISNCYTISNFVND